MQIKLARHSPFSEHMQKALKNFQDSSTPWCTEAVTLYTMTSVQRITKRPPNSGLTGKKKNGHWCQTSWNSCRHRMITFSTVILSWLPHYQQQHNYASLCANWRLITGKLGSHPSTLHTYSIIVYKTYLRGYCQSSMVCLLHCVVLTAIMMPFPNSSALPSGDQYWL